MYMYRTLFLYCCVPGRYLFAINGEQVFTHPKSVRIDQQTGHVFVGHQVGRGRLDLTEFDAGGKLLNAFEADDIPKSLVGMWDMDIFPCIQRTPQPPAPDSGCYHGRPECAGRVGAGAGAYVGAGPGAYVGAGPGAYVGAGPGAYVVEAGYEGLGVHADGAPGDEPREAGDTELDAPDAPASLRLEQHRSVVYACRNSCVYFFDY